MRWLMHWSVFPHGFPVKFGGIDYFCNMKRHFNTHIEGIDLDYWHELIESRGELVTFNTGDYLCRIDEPSALFGYVKSGYFCYEQKVAGEEVKIGGFAFEGALIGDFPFCMRNEPAHFNIVARKKSEVWLTDAPTLCDMRFSDFNATLQFELLMESGYRSLIERYCSLISKSPKERYRELVNRHPQIEQDVPQKDIAAYLQISPQYLCRIRKSLI